MEGLEITCPYCWERVSIEALAPAAEAVEFVTDCEVCCRPIRVVARFGEEDEAPELWVEAES